MHRLYRHLPSLKHLVLAVVVVVTVNLFVAVQLLPPLRFARNSIERQFNDNADRPDQTETLFRRFFSLPVDRLACVVPDFPLFNDDFNRIYGRDIAFFRDSNFTCNSVNNFDVELHFNETSNALSLTKTIPPADRCAIRCVVRDFDNDITFTSEQPLTNTTPTVLTKDCEFFRFSCYRNNSFEPMYADIFSKIGVIGKNYQQIHKQTKGSDDNNDERPFNVFMFGMDGVSRQNFLRLMTETRGFFNNSFDLVDFKIYNKVRDNTFVNVIPMTTGHFVDDLPWNESIAAKATFDDFKFIWKKFSSIGYKTIYAEDFPEISIFNYLKFGFKRPPTDFYFRPANLAMTADRDSWHGHEHLCFKKRFEADYVLEFVKSAILQTKLSSDPYFAFTYLTRITHENQALAVIADKVYASFFKGLSLDGLLDADRTIVVLFSDHGTRWGNYRTTLYGKYEERLPAFAIALPKSFKTEYPEGYENLLENSKKLVTPFDVYHSLVDILRISQRNGEALSNTIDNKNVLGQSLFSKIPWSRSCQQAGVEQHWCACHSLTEQDTQSRASIDLAIAVVAHLNANIVAPISRSCSNWSLASILEIKLLKPNDKFLLFKSNINDVNDRTVMFDRLSLEKVKTRLAFYLVTILARPPIFQNQPKPPAAVFEATVQARVSTDGSHSQVLVEGISRLNAYTHEADCLNIHSLKPYCHCHNSGN